MPKLTIEIDVGSEEEAKALEIFVKAAPEVKGRMLLSAVTGMTQDDLWTGMPKWEINADPDPTGMCSCCHKEGIHRIVTLFLGTYRIDLTLCETCMTRTDIVVGATPEDRLTGTDAKGLPTDSFLEYLLSRKYQTYDLFLTPSRKETP